MWNAAAPVEKARPGAPRNAKALKMVAPVTKYMSTGPMDRSPATKPVALSLAERAARQPTKRLSAR